MRIKDIFPKESYTVLVAILEYYTDQYKQCWAKNIQLAGWEPKESIRTYVLPHNMEV